MKAQQQSDTDSHIAISGEVTVNLQSISVYSHQILETGIKGRIIKDTLHEVDTDIIGNDCFLEQTGENKENPPPEHLLRNEKRFPDLRNKVAGTHDRSCHQLGEERYVEGIVQKIGQWLYFLSVNVDGVAQ